MPEYSGSQPRQVCIDPDIIVKLTVQEDDPWLGNFHIGEVEIVLRVDEPVMTLWDSDQAQVRKLIQNAFSRIYADLNTLNAVAGDALGAVYDLVFPEQPFEDKVFELGEIQLAAYVSATNRSEQPYLCFSMNYSHWPANTANIDLNFEYSCGFRLYENRIVEAYAERCDGRSRISKL